jgi:hypothetical protein
MRRSVWYASAIVLSGLAAADAAYWYVAVARLRDGVQAWASERRARGWTVSLGPSVASGWPAAAVLSLPGAQVGHTGTEVPGAFAVSAERLELRVRLLRPDRLEIAPGGAVRLAFAGMAPVTVRAGALRVDADLSSDGRLGIGFAGSAVALDREGGWHASAATVDARADTAADGGIGFSAGATAVALPAGVRWPLGGSVANAAAEGTLHGPLPEERNAAKWGDAWRDGGGSLEVKRLSLEWGPLAMTSSATLALDEELQPMGSGSAKVTGYAEALDRLAAASVLSRSAATVAKAVLSLLAGSAEGDEPSTVEVPLTLQFRTLSMRQVPLARLPELDWPAR